MFTSCKKTYDLTNADSHQSSTLFEFLKKKKKIGMDTSLIKSRQTVNRSVVDNPPLDYSDINAETERTLTNRKTERVEITPKKVTFAEDYDSLNKKSANTFINMISPLKKRHSIGNTNQVSSSKTSSIPTYRQSKHHKKNLSQNFTRKNLNDSVSILKDTLQSLIKQGQSVKSKAHALTIELRPILKFVEEGNNKNFARRAQQGKQKLRLFEHAFKQFEIEEVNHKIEAFHCNLSEHLNSAQSQIRAQYERGDTANLIRQKENHQKIVDQLLEEKEKLQRKVDNLEKKNQKLQAQKQKLLEEQEERLITYHEASERKQNNLESKIQKLEEQNENLIEQTNVMKQRMKQLEKQARDLKYAKEEVEKKLLQENQTVKSAKEEFLINEIMVMKAEFQRDMKQLAMLYSSQQQQQTTVIIQLKNQLQQIKQSRKASSNRQKAIDQDCDNLRIGIAKYKKQNEYLVNDMHRINQELYQHWLALKDVKSIASRLNLMQNFAQIYQDIPFNDQLFS